MNRRVRPQGSGAAPDTPGRGFVAMREKAVFAVALAFGLLFESSSLAANSQGTAKPSFENAKGRLARPAQVFEGKTS